jgi:hypothetical protein
MQAVGLSRVLVALGAAATNRPAVAMGVGLAAVLGVSLEALFVEDANLLRLGLLPFASEISALTGARRVLAAGELERALRAEATGLEHLLAAAAAPHRVPWSFAVARGDLLAEAMARDADLIVFGAPMRPAVRAREPEWSGPVAVLFDASSDALRALAAATRLARALARQLIIIVPAADGDTHPAVRQRAREWLAAEQVEGQVVPVTAARPALVAAVRSRKSGALALPASGLSARHLQLAMLVAEVTCPVLIVR